MKKFRIFLFAALTVMPLAMSADEGMWLVHLLNGNIYKQMRSEGLKLKAGEIYNELSPALCNAVVAVDGGMGTGSIISPSGLMITNHHVAYGDICALSTPECNYLENGFWASERKDEIPVKGKTVTFLRKVVDVTAEAQELKAKMIAENNWGIFGSRKLYSALAKRYEANTEYEIDVVSMFRGQMYLMFYYQTFKDVRLVGAPPVRIGAFGGETDNWGWPQHKGDFALYRVYGDKTGKPAQYSIDNTPISPVKYLKISTGGIHTDDYAMVIGFPGKTDRYVSSMFINEKQQIRNPVISTCRRERLDIMKKHMEADDNVRLLYSDRYFGISNYADYAKWENICLRRQHIAERRAAEEQAMQQWIDADPARKEKYGTLMADLSRGYAARATDVNNRVYFQETWLSVSEVMSMASRMNSLVKRMRNDFKQAKYSVIDSITWDHPEFNTVKSFNIKRYEESDLSTDRELFFYQVSKYVNNVDPQYWNATLTDLMNRYDNDVTRMVEDAYAHSFLTSIESVVAYFQTPRTAAEIAADPIVTISRAVEHLELAAQMRKTEKAAGVEVDATEALYQRARYEYLNDCGKAQYPNANSTMRLTYGTVGAIHPSDAVFYDYRSTIAGYTEKYNPDDYEFRVDDRMRQLIADKEWGRWGEKGVLYVNFLTNNDITGGNSGSPVLNANGDIIGLAFDGNRDSMAGDVYFHSELNKCVCVDIRFVMWLIEKYSGASFILDEISLAK